MMFELGSDIEQTVNRQMIVALREGMPIAVTGAGISVASGLPLGDATIQGIKLPAFFRRSLWEEHPADAFDAYREILRSWRKAKPNPAHYALARRKIPVVTQNIDGLHRDAGNQDLIEMHGNLRELLCHQCDNIYTSDLVWTQTVPCCPTCQHMLYPGITMEGEPVRHITRAVEWVGQTQCLLIVGTALNMEPVRRLREIAQQNQATVIWIDNRAEYWLPQLLNTL